MLYSTFKPKSASINGLTESIIRPSVGMDEQLTVFYTFCRYRLGCRLLDSRGFADAEPLVVIESCVAIELQAMFAGSERYIELLRSPRVEISRRGRSRLEGSNELIVFIDIDLRAGFACQVHEHLVGIRPGHFYQIFRPRAGGHILEHEGVGVIG